MDIASPERTKLIINQHITLDKCPALVNHLIRKLPKKTICFNVNSDDSHAADINFEDWGSIVIIAVNGNLRIDKIFKNNNYSVYNVEDSDEDLFIPLVATNDSKYYYYQFYSEIYGDSVELTYVEFDVSSIDFPFYINQKKTHLFYKGEYYDASNGIDIIRSYTTVEETYIDIEALLQEYKDKEIKTITRTNNQPFSELFEKLEDKLYLILSIESIYTKNDVEVDIYHKDSITKFHTIDGQDKFIYSPLSSFDIDVYVVDYIDNSINVRFIEIDRFVPVYSKMVNGKSFYQYSTDYCGIVNSC